MSKAKRVSKRMVSMLLAVLMVFSVASFELATVVAGNAKAAQAGSVSLTAPPAVTVSATRVTRVAKAQYSYEYGTTIVKATPSGVPELNISANIANAAYAGETPVWPSATITFPAGITPDAIPGITITATTINGSVTMDAVFKNGQVYTASISGGTASAGNNIVFLISYYINGTNYVNYAYSYVENIVSPSGIQYGRRANLNFLGGTGGRMYFNSRYLGINVYGNEVTGSGTHGYYNFASGWAANPASPLNTSLELSYDGGTSRAYNGGYSADNNRPQASVYMDTSTDTSLASLNLRISFYMHRSLEGDSSYVNLNSTYVQSGFVQSVTGSDDSNPPGTDATATLQLGIVGTTSVMQGVGDYITATFTGPGPAASGTVYTVTTYNQAPGGGYTLYAFTSVGLTIYKYDKGALRTKINDILSGAAGKGINPQSSFYSSGWDTFKAAYDQANLILNKPNTTQAAIDSALSALNTAYNGLATKTITYAVNYYIVGTSTPIIPSVTGTGAYTGYVLTAVAEDIPGYYLTPFDSSPASISLTEANKTINFYYTARVYTLNFVANGGSSVDSVTQGYNTPIARPADPVKTNYTLTGWYLDQACTQLVTWPYAMPLNGGTLYAGWVLTPVTLTFNSNGGTAVPPVTDVPGAFIQKPADPEKTGYRFDGWFYDISFSQAVSWPLEVPAGSVTVYAKWTYVQYTISFETNGGTIVNPITANPNTAIYPPAEPVRAGYSFQGWFYDNGTFLNAVVWPVVMPEIGFTLYVKWAPITTTINFDTQGGTAVASISALADSAVSAPEPPRKFGYVFAGWTLAGSPYTFSTMPTINITLVATWTLSAKYIQADLKTYKTVNGTLVPVTAARAGDILTVQFTPTTSFYCGATRIIVMYDSSFYTIIGSNNNAITMNSSNTYYYNAVSSYTGTTTSPVSQWPATFVNGESSRYKYVVVNIACSVDSRNHGHPVILNDGTWLFSFKLQVNAGAAGAGRIFMDKRWDRSVSYPTGGEYYYYCANNTMLSTAGESIVNYDTDYHDTIKDIALDTSVPVLTTISFDTGGGSAVSPISGEAGTIVAPPANPVKEGYTFTGWTPAIPSTFPISNMTVTANWSINSYNALFYVDGNLYKTVPTVYGATIQAPANPIKTGYSFTGWSPSVGVMGAADKIFTAMFLINTYNALFYVDGAPYATIATEFGAQIQAPSDPSKPGYTFTGWSPAVGTIGAGNATFNAQFSINSYNAYFIVDGVTVATVTTRYGDPIIPPANPSKPGYVFQGWSPTVGTMGTADKVFTAVWSATVYNAYFMVDDSVYSTAVTVVGESIVLPANPAKDGYTFTGWSNVPAVMPPNDIFIDATWSINTYYVRFRVDGSLVTTIATQYGAAINTPASPSKTGYTFKGWKDIPEKMPSHDLTLDAVFTPNTYYAKFMVDDTVYASVPTPFGTEILAPPNPTKTGYTFVGWDYVPVLMPDSDVTVNAVFQIITFTATFFVEGAVYATYQVPYGQPIELPADPDKAGYTFTGWDDVPAAMPDKNVDINATFTKNIYKAIFMVDGEQYAVVDTAYGETIERPQVPSKTGYTFYYWANLPEEMPNEDVVITGVWAINSYDITYIVDGQTYYTDTVQYGSAIVKPANPTKAGLYFAGWTPSVPAAMPAHSLEVTAVFVSEAYNAIFYVDGSEYARVRTPYGATIVPPANPTKAGSIFLGWDPGIPSSMPAQDLTFVALWYSSTTVGFNLNGGTGTVPATQTGTLGTAVSLPAQGNIAKPGYNFLGWAVSSTATTALASYTFQATSTTLYAVWSKVPSFTAKAGSSTKIDQSSGFIYGLTAGMTSTGFADTCVTVSGNGRLEFTPAGSFGTGTKVDLIDNATNAIVATYYIVIFGDVDGDGNVTAADKDLISMVSSYRTAFDKGSAFEYAADLTQDGIVDSFDLNIIRAVFANIGTIDQTNPGELI